MGMCYVVTHALAWTALVPVLHQDLPSAGPLGVRALDVQGAIHQLAVPPGSKGLCLVSRGSRRHPVPAAGDPRSCRGRGPSTGIRPGVRP